MRLTLRNLLRFLDHTHLGPLETERLRELVEQSDRADVWIQRIRDLRADPEKEAPTLTGDPNVGVVARYLDGSLSEQEIISFEESMLASDELLAEVGSSHWILQQISSCDAPAIPVVMRQTLYDLDKVFGDSAELARRRDDADADDPGVAASMEDLPFVDASEPVVPSPSLTSELDEPGDEENDHHPQVSLDQMTRTANGRSILIGVLVVGLLAGAFGITYWLGRESVRLSQPARVTDPVNAEKGQPGNPDPSGSSELDNGDESPGKNLNDPDAAADPGADTGESSTDETTGNDENGNAMDSGENGASTGDAESGDGEKVPAVATDQPQPPIVETDVENPAATAMPMRPDISWPSAPGTESPEFVGPIQPPRVAARPIGPQFLVMTRSGVDQEWVSMSDQTELREGHQVRVLSGRVASFELGDHLTLFAHGPVTFSIEPQDRASLAEVLTVDSGRIRVQSSTSDVDLHLNCGSERFVITMLLAETTIQFESRRYLPPGHDPRQVAPATVKLIRTLSGRSRVQNPDATWTLPASNALVMVESEVKEISQAPKTGIIRQEQPPTRYVKRLSDVVAQNQRRWLASKTDVVSELLELKGDTRQEFRLAAMVWLSELGNFDFVVDFLGNAANKSNWRTFVEALRYTIQSQPEFAERLFEGLVFSGAENQTKLYGLILGFAPADLENGKDARLVEMLTDTSLAVRVLAIENLREITGGVTFGYVPTLSQTKRFRIVKRQWEIRLNQGKIRYSQPPAIPIRKLSPLPPGGIDQGLDDLDETNGQ